MFYAVVMGLRERNAERTRDHLIDVALELFFTQGYEQTTMEQVAERAEVSSTTLYRYFPTKDLLLLHQLPEFDWGETLRERPEDEPLNVSLAILLRDTLESMGGRPESARLHQLIDETPAARARLWDIVNQKRSNFEKAIAERTGRPSADIVVAMTARMMYQIYDVVFDQWWSSEQPTSLTKVLDKILASLNQQFILPASLHAVQAAV
jgi:AcrR family transcriptional regulator